MWGVETQARMRSSAVCLIGLDGLAAEVAKNIVLSGIGRLHIVEAAPVTATDLQCNFLVAGIDCAGQNVSTCVRV
jgi:ubiquitin-like 1-activating enzyme E1 A